MLDLWCAQSTTLEMDDDEEGGSLLQNIGALTSTSRAARIIYHDEER